MHANSHWKFYILMGIGIAILAYFPAMSPQQPTGSQHPSPKPQAPTVVPLSQPQVTSPDNSLHPKNTAWPPMTADQLEQARIMLIREGFSPMHADSILPTAPSTPSEVETFP